jgi:hypothetical protein
MELYLQSFKNSKLKEMMAPRQRTVLKILLSHQKPHVILCLRIHSYWVQLPISSQSPPLTFKALDSRFHL